jgi:hypothetical protein
MARAMPVATAAVLALPVAFYIFGTPAMDGHSIQAICCTSPYDTVRPALRKELLASPGQDLVFIKDSLQNPTEYELVNNEPDIDKAPVVWAHRLNPEKDARLQNHFAARNVWEFEWLPDTDKGYRFTLQRPAQAQP